MEVGTLLIATLLALLALSVSDSVARSVRVFNRQLGEFKNLSLEHPGASDDYFSNCQSRTTPSSLVHCEHRSRPFVLPGEP